MLPELVEAYYSPNMGLVTHLQYPVQREEDVDEEQGQTTSLQLNSGYNVKLCLSKIKKNPKHSIRLSPAEANNFPPQLPPRNFTVNDVKDSDPKSLSDTFLMRLQQMDLSTYGQICRMCPDAPQPNNSSFKVSDNALAVYTVLCTM